MGKRLIDWLIPWRTEAGVSDDVFRAELVSGISLVFAVVSLIMTVWWKLQPDAIPGAFELCLGSLVLHTKNLFLLRRRSWARIAHWALTLELMTVLTFAAAFTGGYRNFGLGWQLCVPLIVVFLLGLRRGVICGVVMCLQSVAFWYLETSGHFVPPLAHADGHDGAAMFTNNVMLIVVLGLAAVYERAHAARRSALAASNGQLRQAHDDLTAAGNRLIATEKLAGLGMLAAGIAHEINNPMGYVTSNLLSLQDDFEKLLTDSSLRLEYSSEVIPATLDGVRRVNAIVADLRHFAAGTPETFVEYDLNQEIGVALRMAHSKLTEHEARLETRLRELPPVKGLPRDILRVVMNLVINAAQASKPGSVIQIESFATADEVGIKVVDEGSGMSPDTLGKLFQPFFTTKLIGVGMGLGLAVAYGIVSAHSGRIDVESVLGRGTTFTVWLPRAPVTGVALAA